ncbi:glucose-1-phosphate thymidylyltransferase [Anaerolineae bacterium CFX7]|nr:glucose-1-phosphate thymidylyltransferase [Anaerolineae bacterium CFX7]
MKGLILSGGKGTRLRPLTYTGAKQLVPVANKPVLFYALEDLVEAGVTEIGIVISPETGEQVRHETGDGSRFGARITYILQAQPLGIAHAIKIAHDFIGADPFILFLGDNFIRGGIVPQVDAFRAQALDAQIILYEMPDPSSMGVAVLDADGRVQRVVEKPKQFISPYAVIGIYMFGPSVFEAVNQIQPSARGELEITDTIQYLVNKGLNVRAHKLADAWVDTGRMGDMLEANRLVLDVMPGKIEGSVEDSLLEGRVILEAGARVIHSKIRGPAIIGKNTLVENAFVGPYTAIHHDCIVRNCEIEHSIVLENSQLENVGTRVADSLIGRNVCIQRAEGPAKTVHLMLGDFSQVGI